MKTKLVAALALVGGALFSSGASAAVSCDTLTTLGALKAAGSCVDGVDGDMLLTFTSTSAGLPLTTGFELIEVEFPTADFYTVKLNFSGGFAPTSSQTFNFSMTSLNQEPLVAANFDSDIEGTGSGINATADISAGGSPLLHLVTLNGSHDPPGGGETPFPGGGQPSVDIVDTLNPGTNQLYLSVSNSFETTRSLLTPEPATLALLGLGFVGMALRRRSR